MIEVEFQKLVLDGVRKHGGFGWKLSNRFLVGVPDLLIQLPGYPTTLWEVKHRVYAVVRKIKVETTAMQQRFLDKFHMAGGTCGVITFLSVGRHRPDRYVNITPLQDFVGSVERFVPLIPGYREDIIHEEMTRVLGKLKIGEADA